MTANEQVARRCLAAYLRERRNRGFKQTGSHRLAPWWMDNRRENGAGWIEGFLHAMDGESIETSRPWGSTFEEGWRQGVDWIEVHDRPAFRKLMRPFALDDLPISRSEGGPFYARDIFWSHNFIKGEAPAWKGPSQFPVDPLKAAVFMGVNEMHGCLTRWMIRAAEGRSTPALIADIHREIAGQRTGHIPCLDPYWTPEKNFPYQRHLRFHMRAPTKAHTPHPVKVMHISVEHPSKEWNDPERVLVEAKGEEIVRIVRRLFKVPGTKEAFYENTGQGVML